MEVTHKGYRDFYNEPLHKILHRSDGVLLRSNLRLFPKRRSIQVAARNIGDETKKIILPSLQAADCAL